MVDYDSAVEAVQDQNADPIFLAKIAYENPEFGANVAVNPRAYPGLLRWLAEFGDERARETVAQMGFTVAGTPAGANQPTAEAQPAADPYAASPYAQAAQNPYGFTADIARTTTDQMQMAEIAQKAPELYAALAQNPNLYPALVDWLAQLGDPAVNAALASRQ